MLPKKPFANSNAVLLRENFLKFIKSRFEIQTIGENVGEFFGRIF